MEDNKPKPNLAGIAAIITAVTGLIGALAIFYPKSGDSEPKPAGTEQTTTQKADDFCTAITTCINDVDQNFEHIRQSRAEEFENETSQQKEFASTVKIPQSSTNTVNQLVLKDQNGGPMYDFTSEIVTQVKLIDAEVAYDQAMKKLDACLPAYTISNNTEVDDDIIKSTRYEKDGHQVILQVVKEEQTYSVELVIEKSL